MTAPSSVVLVSAHHEQPEVQISADPAPPTVYDFYGFPAPLYQLTYAAPGAPEIAHSLVESMRRAGALCSVQETARRGFDHGAWVPLLELFPQANVPVVQVSLLCEAGDAAGQAERHVQLGAALGDALPEDALLIGSGSLTHAVPERGQRGDTPHWVEAFRAWVHEAVSRQDMQALQAYRTEAPFAQRNHPTQEHLMPLFVLLGAFGSADATLLHTSTMHDVLAMDAYSWR
ncbi:MAG: class III extradiol ring-cleavage dioxygenase [Pseudomonadota bacterium]